MKILHFEDDANDAALTQDVLTSEWPDCAIHHVGVATELRASLGRAEHDLMLADFRVPGTDGHETLRLALEICPATPIIFLSGTIEEDVAFGLIREGAYDYVFKDRMRRLLAVIPRALHENVERRRRIEAERRLHEQADILNRARDAIVIVDPANRITYWNAGAERIYGWPASEVIGRRPEEFLIYDDPARLTEMRRITAERGEWTGELSIASKEGDRRILELRSSTIRDKAGLISGRLTLTSDITEEKRLQEQFLHAQRLETLGLLAAGIAHDLNNVLAPVLMGAPLLRERATLPADRKLLRTLEKSAERGAALVRQILVFTKGIGGENRAVDVKRLVSDVVAILSASLPKSIRVETDFPSELWPVEANLIQLHQVLLNLCVNARDAMPPGGILRIKIENHRLDPRAATTLRGIPPGRYIAIEVSDTGTGIEPSLLPRIWEPFFTTKNTDKGTGLGLSTVRGIIQNHHGHIEVHSEIGVGTTFRIFLPALTEPPTTQDTPSVSPFTAPRGRGELILIVDDETEILELATTLLAAHGYGVIAVTDGMQAYAPLVQRGDDIRLILTDLNMPELDGAGLALLARRQLPKIKILAMSGKSSGSDLSADYRQCTDAFLHKPFTPRALFEAVDSVLHPPGS